MANQVHRPLDLVNTYPCPVCRHGTLEALALTDAFACEFCRHILSADLIQQQVQVVDSPQTVTWQWDGQRWRIFHENRDATLSGLVGLVAVSLVVLPAGVVWLAGSIFPPLSPPPQLSFSTIWAMMTLLTHLVLVLWLVGEYYQIPFYVATKARLLRRRYSQRT